VTIEVLPAHDRDPPSPQHIFCVPNPKEGDARVSKAWPQVAAVEYLSCITCGEIAGCNVLGTLGMIDCTIARRDAPLIAGRLT
jgi:hypothetical protein